MQLRRLLTVLRSETLNAATPEPSRSQVVEPAYLVPWQVSSRAPGESLTVVNVSSERLRFVRFAVAGEGALRLSLPVHVEPGESIHLDTSGVPAHATSTMITVRWFIREKRGDAPEAELEFLWLIAC